MPDIKERPILFSAPMIRAILDDRKTQTRRVVKLDAELRGRGCTGLDGAWVDPGLGAGAYMKVPGPHETAHRLYSPYGYKRDRLWVRETWRVRGGQEYEYQRHQPSVVYKASADATDLGPWKPSIFMRRWASRITLAIETIRVQRLGEISEEDAIAEGVDAVSVEKVQRQATWTRRSDYRQLWDKLNARRGFGWATNPWVWVIEFRRVLDG